MIKSFKDLREGDRVLLVYGQRKLTAICTAPPVKADDKMIGFFFYLSIARRSSITRDRNFQIPVFAQSNV